MANTYLFDMIIMICMCVWFYKYEYYMGVENEGWGLQKVPTDN